MPKIEPINKIEVNNNIRILYYGFHDILAYDEVSMLSRMGCKVFSACIFNKKIGHSPYRTLNENYIDPALDEIFSREGLTEDFVKNFDLVIYVHNPAEDMSSIIGKFYQLPVIYRSIGQCTNRTEEQLRRHESRVKIVRYCDNEVSGLQSCRTDAVIRFAKNLDDVVLWKGGARASTFHSFYPQRPLLSTPNLDDYMKIGSSNGFDLYGRANEGIPYWRGLVTAEDQANIFSSSAMYLYIHTLPTSYTLNLIEALAVGCPIIAPSTNYIRNSAGIHAHALNFDVMRYDVPRLLSYSEECLFDSADDLLIKANKLWSDANLRLKISSNNIKLARELFDEKLISEQWSNLFSKII